jgi:hypothetical protein
MRFSEYFAEAWAHPTPDNLVALLHDDVVLYQPQRSPVRGKAAAHAEFQRLLNWLPNLFGVVDRFLEQDNIAFIEWRLQLPVNGQLVSIPAVDRFLLQDGLGKERVVYFDQMLMNTIVAKHPSLWAGAVKYRLGF